MALIETWLRCELGSAVQVQYLNGNLFSQDNQANLIGVRVYENGEPASLSGSVSANVIRADGGTVAVAGTLQNGNECYVILPQAAYAVPGAVSVIIKITSSGQVTTLAAAVSTVYTSSTATAVDPGTIIPSIQSLISAIETAVASIPADYSSLWTSLAPAFSTSTAYTAGQYTTYDGKLWRFTTDHAAGSWNAAHAVQVNLGGDVSDLKSAIVDNVNGITGCKIAYFEKGRYYTTPSAGSTPEYKSHSNYASTKIEVSPGDVVYLHTRSNTNSSSISSSAWLDASGNILSKNSINQTDDRIYLTPTNAKYLIVNDQLSQLASGYYAFVGEKNTFSRIFSLLSNDVADGINGITGCKQYLFQNGYWSTPTAGNVSEFTYSINYKQIKIPVSEGDLISYNVGNTQSSTPVSYALLDSSYVVVSKGTTQNDTITIPSGVSYIVVNNKNSDMSTGYFVFKGNGLASIIAQAMQNTGSASGVSSCDDVRGNSIMFVGSSGTTPNIPDYPVDGAGWLWTITNLSQSMQIAFPWEESKIIKYRTRKSGVWQNWVTFSGGGDIYEITNNYSFPTSSNTYNISCSPTITADTNNYLASTGDTTDRTADIVTMLQTTGVCHLGTGDFYVKDLVMPVKTSIIGSGTATKVQMIRGSDGCAIQLNTECMVKDLSVIGADSSPVGTNIGGRHGILWAGQELEHDTHPTRSIIDNVYVTYFSGGGITCYDTGYATTGCVMVTNAYVSFCWAGINIPFWAEYNKFTNVRCHACMVGCVNNGGNNMFANCDFSSCYEIAMLFDNSSEQSRNNTHGSCVGCVFNHTRSGGQTNAGIGVKMLNCSNGFIFDGCQFFFSRIHLENSDGVVFSNCNFGVDNCGIEISGGGAVMFANNMHQGQPTITITDNNNVHFANCYVRSTGSVVTN